MSRCQCITSNGEQCFRNSHLDSQYCWQYHKQSKKNNHVGKDMPKKRGIPPQKGGQPQTRTQTKNQNKTQTQQKRGATGGIPAQELQILKQSSKYYQDRIPFISEDEYKMIEPDLAAANRAIRNGEIAKAVRHLTNVYEIADEHNFLTEHMNYPGPGQLQKLVNYLDQVTEQLGGQSSHRVLNRKERSILNQTYKYYQDQFRLLTEDEYELVRADMELAFEAINRGDSTMAVRYLTSVYEIADEHHFIPEEITYPGPHDFSNLAGNLDQVGGARDLSHGGAHGGRIHNYDVDDLLDDYDDDDYDDDDDDDYDDNYFDWDDDDDLDDINDASDLLDYLDLEGGERGNLTKRQISKILNDTYQYYENQFENLNDDEYELVRTDLNNAYDAIHRGDVETAVRHLTNVYEIADEHDYLPGDIMYPGPGQFEKLSNYLD